MSHLRPISVPKAVHELRPGRPAASGADLDFHLAPAGPQRRSWATGLRRLFGQAHWEAAEPRGGSLGELLVHMFANREMT